MNVAETINREKLSYGETARQFDLPHSRVTSWERIYLEEGKEGFYVERRERGSTGRPPKVKKKVEEDLITAHEMGHVISGKIKNGKSGLDIYKETVYNVSGKRISDDEALEMLFDNISAYSTKATPGRNGNIAFNEIISEILSINVTAPNRYSSEFVRLLKDACNV